MSEDLTREELYAIIVALCLQRHSRGEFLDVAANRASNSAIFTCAAASSARNAYKLSSNEPMPTRSPSGTDVESAGARICYNSSALIPADSEVGRALLDALIASTEPAGVWTLQSGIFPENTARLALHEAAGFRIVGVRERLGRHHGRWRDVVLVEGRSPAIT